LAEEAAAAAIVNAVLDRVADAAADSPALRLRILFGVFNAVPHGRVRLGVLLRTLAFATETSQAAALSHVVLRVDAWAAEWGVSAAELRALRLAVYELLSRAEPTSQAAFSALVAYLALYEASQLGILDAYPRADALCTGRGTTSAG
jgi:translation initiation factor 3 subunit M